ncbi:MAG: hypothetical protein J0H98_01320 [Solirubrobacterales bacterium]|nr:hypothetical protein [Solirubrobacterales bacterium]
MPEFTISQSATPEEAAAIAAAVQRFSQDTAVAPPVEATGMDPWLKAALRDGVSAKEAFGPGQPFGIA